MKHAHDQQPRTGVIHPVYFRLICRTAESEGISADTILAPAGLNWDELIQREEFLSFEQSRKIIYSAQNLIGRPTLALELGLKTGLGLHGLIGQTVSYSHDIRQAITTLAHFLPIRTKLFRLSISFDKKGALLRLHPSFPFEDLRGFLLDHFAAGVSKILGSLIATGMTKLRLDIPWAEPSWANVYRQLANEIRFNCDHMAFWIPDEILNLTCVTASRAHFQESWKRCEIELENQEKLNTVTMVIQGILQANINPLVTEKDIANHLGISARSLVRRLADEGSSFRTLKENSQKEIALWHLRFSQMSINQIGQLLGFSNPSNFNRLFRKWFDMTPTLMRQKIQQDKNLYQ